MNSLVLDPRLRQLLDDHVGTHVSSVTETPGEQGDSGARIRYFTVSIDDEHAPVVVKNATELERRVVSLLHEQGQAVPRSTCSTMTAARDWLVMEHTEEIPYGDSEVGAWPSRLGVALARITRPIWARVRTG